MSRLAPPAPHGSPLIWLAAPALFGCVAITGACRVEPAGTAAGGSPALDGGRGSGGATDGSGGTGGIGGSGSTGSGGGTGGDGSAGTPAGTGGRATGGRSGEGGRTLGSGGRLGSGGTGGRGGASGTGSGGASATGGAGGAPATGGNNAIVAVGYGGLRVVSRDLGVTWQNESHWSESGGDDNNLLRAIAYGNGVWVSGGWRYVTSADGIAWTDHGMTVDVITAVSCNIIESIAFGQGRFVGACGENLVSSTDGLVWKKLGPTPSIEKHPWLVFDPGTARFAVTGDNSKSFVSSDMGVTWTELTSVVGVRLCKGGLNSTSACPGFYADGVFLRGSWPAQVQRSTDGTTWSKAVALPAGDSVFTDYSFAVGHVGP